MQVNLVVCRFRVTVVVMGTKPLPRGTLSWGLGVAIRARLEVSQRQLADDIGVSKDTLERWLSGQRAMNVDNLAAIAQLLGVRPAVLVREAQEALLDAALEAGGTVTPIRAGTPHPTLSIVTRFDDDEAAADESLDEDAERERRGE